LIQAFLHPQASLKEHPLGCWKGKNMAQEVKAHVRQISTSASQGTARNHSVYSDRPEAKGGGNKGPMGGELFLMGLGGCFMSNLLAAVQAREAAVSDLSIEIVARLEEAPPRFSEVKLNISGNYSDKDLMKKIVAIAERGCIVANTVKAAVKLTFEVL
jgi:putative redox protein